MNNKTSSLYIWPLGKCQSRRWDQADVNMLGMFTWIECRNTICQTSAGCVFHIFDHFEGAKTARGANRLSADDYNRQ